MRKFIKRLLIVFFIICLVTAGFVGYAWIHSTDLGTTYYTVEQVKCTSSFRIVHLSDQHCCTYGDNNEQLINAVKDANPDLILCTGDFVNRGEEDISVMKSTFQSLSEIAPLYASYGNHEKSYEQTFGVDLTPVMEEAGATVLDWEWQEIEINSQSIRLGGIYGYCVPDFFKMEDPVRIAEQEFVREFQSTDKLSILLCHMPACWLVNGGIELWDVNLVLSGHAHGGQIRLPFVGGLYAPDQGWFPESVEGVTTADDAAIVVSRGLGTYVSIPRLWNPPEIVVIDVINKGKKNA